jgi:dipeptidyl aminopeptidase/acylaminoacyl peptidase
LEGTVATCGARAPGGRRAWFALALCLAMLLPVAAAHAAVDLAPFLRRDGFQDLALSPKGDYYAATVAREDRTVLVVIRRADKQRTSTFTLGANAYIHRFEWVSDTRLLVSVAERFGSLEKPIPTGEIYGVNADGSRARLLLGYRAVRTGDDASSEPAAATGEPVAGYLLDRLPGDGRKVLVEIWPLTEVPQTRVDTLDIHSGARSTVATAPVPRATFTTDNAGKVRFARGYGPDNASLLYHRADDGAEWALVNDENRSGRTESVLGFAADNAIAFLRVQASEGPDAVVSMDTRTGERKALLRDAELDPWHVLRAPGASQEPVGVMYSGSSVRAAFFDEQGAHAKLHRALEDKFRGDPVRIVSSSDDGRTLLLESWSHGNPGDFFLLDLDQGRADRVVSRRDWILPSKASPVKPVRFKARDGLALQGFLTRPAGRDGPLPMVVLPHGGPFGEFDEIGYDDDSQLLASAGYAVLRVNFRGSGNRGRAFLQAGAREWGGAMQRDLADATRWAIAQGHAEAGRICIVGASYGAYAAMQGLAQEPDLFRCGIGHVGVYDLERMVRDQGKRSRASALWSAQWVGEGDMLRAGSAVAAAPRIKAPVLLVAGGRDTVAPIAQSRAMERALRDAGVPVQTLYVPTEGHGFFAETNRRAHLTAMLAFLSLHLGGAKAQ